MVISFPFCLKIQSEQSSNFLQIFWAKEHLGLTTGFGSSISSECHQAHSTRFLLSELPIIIIQAPPFYRPEMDFAWGLISMLVGFSMDL